MKVIMNEQAGCSFTQLVYVHHSLFNYHQTLCWTSIYSWPSGVDTGNSIHWQIKSLYLLCISIL